MRRLASILVLLSLVLAARPALPCGPGVHVRDAGRALDLLVASDPEWAVVASDPLALSYLRLGAISPDFQQMAAELKFGHNFALSYHLLDAGKAKGPLFRALALGHLAHASASDPACEMFLAPTLTASSALGLLDLTKTYDDNKGESEGIFEAFGDLVLGDWDAIVDVLYDFYLEGDEAKARGREAFVWYCTEGAASEGRSTDCDKAWGEFAGMLDQADGLLGGQDRDSAKEFAHSITDQPPPDLAELFMGGFIQQLLGERMEKSEQFEREYQRFLRSAVVTDAYWQPYREFLGLLAPRWAADRASAPAPVFGFQSWTPNALVSGNIQSMMQFVPEAYQVVPGLIVDSLDWKDGNGADLTHLTAADEGKAGTLVVQFFSAYPFTGTVKAQIRKDLPGLDSGNDPVVGEGGAPFTIDPLAYVSTPRSTLEVPFTIGTSGALGLYAELWVEGGTGPWFTTSWDRLWTIRDIDLDRPAIRGNFGTYDHWPRSLRVDTPDVTDANLFVKAFVAPAGGGVDLSNVVVGENDRVKVTGWNGIAVFDQAGDQPLELRVTAPGFLGSDVVTAQPVAYQDTWVFVPLHGVPQVATPAGWQADRACVAFQVAEEPFQGQVDRFVSTAATIDEPIVTSASVEAVPARAAKACFGADLADGTLVVVSATTRYLDGTSGVTGQSVPVGIDGSAPIVDLQELVVEDSDACTTAAAEARWPVEVSVAVTEPHSPLTGVEWKDLSGAWQPAGGTEVPGELPGSRMVTFRPDPFQLAAGGLLAVRAANAAGLSTEVSATVPAGIVQAACPPEPTPDPGPGDPGVTPDRGLESDVIEAGGETVQTDLPAADVGGGSSGGGCSAGGPATGRTAGPAAWWLLLALPLLAVRRRRV
jgi:hypothetical protein